MYDYAVFIGRFAPFHSGHLKVVTRALELSDYLVMVVGSCNRARNTRNPFTFEERVEMIRASLPGELVDRVLITPAEDYLYNEPKWLAGIQTAVKDAIDEHLKLSPLFSYKGWRDYPQNIALAGMYKDATSYYINSFPQWDNSIAITPEQNEGDILSATRVRKHMFFGEVEKAYPLMNQDAYHKMIGFASGVGFSRLFDEWDYEQKYEAVYGKGPHHTVDACIVEAGHVLLIQRGKEYGHGLWAMPGGFMNRRERILDAMLRELVEETEIKVPYKVLKGSITRVQNYDDPYRSNRSHVITTAYRIDLEHHVAFPKVKGCDDAMDARWVPISEIESMKEQFFEDHYDMLSDLLGL